MDALQSLRTALLRTRRRLVELECGDATGTADLDAFMEPYLDEEFRDPLSAAEEHLLDEVHGDRSFGLAIC